MPATKTAPAPAGHAISYSGLEQWACPYHGKRLRIDKAKEPETIPLLRGQVGHDFCRRYIEHCASRDMETDTSALPELFRAAWESGKCPPEEMDGLKIACGNVVNSIVVNVYTLAEQQYAVTREWKDTAWFGKGVWLRAVIDRLDVDGAEGIITDFSFGWGKAEEKQLQVKIYAAVANVIYPEVERWTTRIFNAQNRTEAESVIAIDQIPRIRKDIESESRRIEAIVASGKFPAVPGDHCGYCGFLAECPVEASAPALGSADAARAALGELIVLDEKAKRIKAALRTWTNGAGPLEQGGMVIGHFPTATKVFDKQAVILAAEQAGLDHWSFFNVNQKAAGFKKLGVEPVSIKPGVTFKVKKAGQEGEDE